jgi:hypothetical protein
MTNQETVLRRDTRGLITRQPHQLCVPGKRTFSMEGDTALPTQRNFRRPDLQALLPWTWLPLLPCRTQPECPPTMVPLHGDERSRRSSLQGPWRPLRGRSGAFFVLILQYILDCYFAIMQGRYVAQYPRLNIRVDGMFLKRLDN